MQVLTAGDAVVAAARRPEQSPGLSKLKQQHGDALQLVKLDVNDRASVKVCSRDEIPRVHLCPRGETPAVTGFKAVSLPTAHPVTSLRAS